MIFVPFENEQQIKHSNVTITEKLQFQAAMGLMIGFSSGILQNQDNQNTALLPLGLL